MFNVEDAVRQNTKILQQLLEHLRQLNKNVQELNTNIQKQVDPKLKK